MGLLSAALPPATRTMVPLTVPSTNCILIKTDAAWIESVSIAGLGWIVESQNRTSSYSAPAHHVKSPLAAEALALLEALVKCRELGLSRIRCESDSAVLIKAIKAESSLAGLYGILADIQALAFSFEYISFQWISRMRM